METGPLLSEKTATRDNNFDFLRFMAATQVILYHTFALSGNYSGTLWNSYKRLLSDSGLGVSVFFIISGFLILKSRMDSPGLLEYLKKRVLRIAPGLALAVAFCVLVVGPLTSSLGLHEYFTSLTGYRDHLPRVFEKNHIPYLVNGSLWTLKVEVFAYMIIAALGFMRAASLKMSLTLLVLLLVVIDAAFFIMPEYSGMKIGSIYANQSVRYLIFFMAGSMLYMYRDKVPLNGYLFSLLLLAFVVSQHTVYWHFVSFLALPYMVIYFAYSGPPFNRFGKYGDFSYGLYILAFPVQQTLLYYSGGRIGNATFLAAAFFITLALAVISWNVVEKPALRLKKVQLSPWH